MRKHELGYIPLDSLMIPTLPYVASLKFSDSSKATLCFVFAQNLETSTKPSVFSYIYDLNAKKLKK